MAWSDEYKKNYHKNYYLTHRVLIVGKKSYPKQPINCSICSVLVSRTSSNQKVCIKCKPSMDKLRRNNWFNNNYKSSEKFREKRRILVRKNVNKYYANNLEKERIRKRSVQNTRRALGTIDINDIQKLYESNILKYGTLTCYLCIKPILFKEDSIEHKIPISLGGNNNYENLEVAHLKCNIRKGKKLLLEGCFK